MFFPQSMTDTLGSINTLNYFHHIEKLWQIIFERVKKNKEKLPRRPGNLMIITCPKAYKMFWKTII